MYNNYGAKCEILKKNISHANSEDILKTTIELTYLL